VAIVRTGFIDLYVALMKLAQKNKQIIGEKSDYFVTLEQIQEEMKNLEELHGIR
jgi:hypothetical protein